MPHRVLGGTVGDRCRVYRIATDDLDRSVDDPALSLLLAEGWTVVAPIAIEEKNEVLIALIMAPPQPDKIPWKFIAGFAAVGGLLIAICSLLLNGGQL